MLKRRGIGPRPGKLIYTSAELVAHEGPFVAPDFDDDDDVVDFEEYMQSVVDERIANDPTGQELQAHIVCLGEDVVRWRERYDADDYYDEERHHAALVEFLKYAKRVTGPAVSPRVQHYIDMAHKFEDLMVEAEKLASDKTTVEASPTFDDPFKPKGWPTIDEAAFHGLAGKIVDTIAPHVEADRVALLATCLTMVGNVAGHRLYWQADRRHYANLYTNLVGDTSGGRKGSSLGALEEVFTYVDETWARMRIKGGIGSGEGIINALRDPRTVYTGKKSYEDPGVADKRLLVIEQEFGTLFAVMERLGSIVNMIIRKGWDGAVLEQLTKSDAGMRASNTHLSFIAHITETELKKKLTTVDQADGFANRLIFLLVHRAQELPFGGDLAERDKRHLGELIGKALDQLKFERADNIANPFEDMGEMVTPIQATMSAEVRAAWPALYSELTKGKPSLLGATIARRAPQVLRLCLCYCLLDGTSVITTDHLNAALALWRYSEACCHLIFADALGDTDAERILHRLKEIKPGPLNPTQINAVFNGHVSVKRINLALDLLLKLDLVRAEDVVTKGRPTRNWYAR